MHNGRIPKIGVRFTAGTANDVVDSILATLNHYSATCGMRPHDALGCLAMVQHSVLMSMSAPPRDDSGDPPPEPEPEPSTPPGPQLVVP